MQAGGLVEREEQVSRVSVSEPGDRETTASLTPTMFAG